MLDQLQRLYKRHAQRIVREQEQDPTHSEESVMSMRKRLGR